MAVELIQAELQEQNGRKILEQALGATGRTVGIKPVVETTEGLRQILGTSSGKIIYPQELLAVFGISFG
jgi:hypothetical protein